MSERVLFCLLGPPFSYLKCIGHKAPALLRIHPLSLQEGSLSFPHSVGRDHQDGRRWCLSFPHSVGKVHQWQEEDLLPGSCWEELLEAHGKHHVAGYFEFAGHEGAHGI